jgi:hypothetical protein
MYSLTVVAVDKAGNVSAPNQPVATPAKWTPPTNLRVTSVSGGTVSLAWNGSWNMPQACRYYVYADRTASGPGADAVVVGRR